ncbi:hypothetical protein [Vibrio sp. WXL103]|uniref:hypothetical protein n=1 Tax=Vibrio sp. WXL103 TaxID=3450710 RepID=UPI003EC93962
MNVQVDEQLTKITQPVGTQQAVETDVNFMENGDIESQLKQAGFNQSQTQILGKLITNSKASRRETFGLYLMIMVLSVTLAMTIL